MKTATIVNFLGLALLWFVSYATFIPLALWPTVIYACASSFTTCALSYRENQARTKIACLLFSVAGLGVACSTLPFTLRSEGPLELALMIVFGAGGTWLPMCMIASGVTYYLYSVSLGRLQVQSSPRS
jgi:hypothetical protein